VACLVVLALLAGCGGQTTVKGPTPPNTAVATATLAPGVVFQDNLTTDTNRWADGNHSIVKADGLHIIGGYYIYVPFTPPADVEVSVRSKRILGPDTGGYGIVMRRTPGNRYEFDITGKGEWYVLKQVNKQFSSLVDPTPNAAIKTSLNATNTLKVRAQGSHFEFWVNDLKVGEVTDAANAGGAFGLDGDNGLEVVYTDLLAVAVH
jgi:hypothetical protein